MRIPALLALMTMIALPESAADRPVTDAERGRLVAALAAEGCTGGRMEWNDDDREFEVDDATCRDGQRYDFEFDAQYRMTKKELDR
jgi:hypothetical protein